MQTNAEALTATVAADEAAVRNAEEAIKADEAAIENAKLQLSYCFIHTRSTAAPGSGLDVGNLAAPKRDAAPGNPAVGPHLRRFHDFAKRSVGRAAKHVARRVEGGSASARRTR